MIGFAHTPAAADGLAPAPTRPAAAPRDPALDFAKGALVLCMIVYHTLNYFRYDPNLLRHLHFLPPSFIFIAGFLVSHLYLPKIRAGDASVPRRLLLRGAKTLLLFVGLNLLAQSFVRSSYNRALGLDAFLDRLDIVFITGEERAAVFGVLLPISYTLFVAAVLLAFARRLPFLIPLVATATVAACVVLDRRGLLVFNLDLVSMGLLGTLCGLLPRTAIQRATGSLALLAVAYLGYSVAVRFQYPTYLMNVVGITLSLLLFYALGARLPADRTGAGVVTLLGNYSLLAYLVQIAVLQLLFRALRLAGLPSDQLALPLLLTTAATIGAIKLTDALRARAPAADRGYRAVFA